MDEDYKTDNENLLRLDLKCNMNCIFCNIKNTQEKYFSKNEMICEIKKIANSENITITGGEPTLDLNLINYISYAKKNNIKNIILQTNGTLFSSKKYTKKIKEAGLTRIFLSFHCFDKNIFEKITRLKNGYDLVLKGIQNALDNDIEIVINILATKMNYIYMQKTIQFLINKFPKLKELSNRNKYILFSLSTIQPHGNAFLNQEKIVEKISNISPYLIDAMKYCLKNNLTFTNPGCGVPFCQIIGYEKYSSEYNSINKEILFSSRDKIKSTKCSKCKYNNSCQGVWKKYSEIYGLDELKPIK